MSTYRHTRNIHKLLLLHSTPIAAYKERALYARRARTVNLAHLWPFNRHRNYVITPVIIINGTVYAGAASNERALHGNEKLFNTPGFCRACYACARLVVSVLKAARAMRIRT